jgi:pre-mRNA 3'-end-processing factor FIP1
VITRARFIKTSLEAAGYRLIPWDFKKGQPPTFWTDEQERLEGTMEEEDDDLYGPSETTTTKQEVKDDSDGGDEPMDEAESGEEEESDDSDSVCDPSNR